MRLIDADEVFEMADEFPAFEECLADKTDLKDLLNICDTVEAKPIVHAHWEAVMAPPVPWAPEECYEAKAYKCSNCKKTLNCETPYCAFCSAQMDEVAGGINVGGKNESIKIPVISMEDVLKVMEEVEK